MIELEEEELRTQAPDFWENQKQAEEQMRKVRSIKQWIDLYEEAATAVEELTISYDFYKEEMMSEQELDGQYAHTLDIIERVELKNMLRNEGDKLGAVLKIVAGAGGTEAQDWASMLMRMYLRYCEANGYKAEIVNLLEGGKRMTSFSSVFVVPLVDDSIEIDINPANLSWDTFRSSGAGGQNVNKVETGVRLHYKFVNPVTEQPDEIVIENTESRSQFGNKDNAMRLLRSQLYELELEKRNAETAKIEAGKKKIEWGSQIRSYVFDDRRVKDHRTNYQTSNVNAVMDGDLEAFIKAYLMEFGGQ